MRYIDVCRRVTDLDGSPGKAAQLFDVLPFLADDGAHGLCWNVNVDRFLLWSLKTQITEDITDCFCKHAHTSTRTL